MVGFSDPHDVEILDDDTVIIAEKFSHHLKIVSLSGGLTDTVGTGRPGEGPNTFRRPSGIELQGTDLWIADSGNNRVLRCKFKWN